MIIPVILAGGSGSRLWPLSRESYPKQFIPLFGGESLFQKTIARCEGLPDVSQVLVVGNAKHHFLLNDLLSNISLPILTTLLEPSPKSTAPAVALAAMAALELTQDDPLLLILPADHVIDDVAGFQHSVLQGIQAATSGFLVTFGVQPKYPETGYGYIQAGNPLPGQSACQVSAFIEKPDFNRAQSFVKSNEHYWNSGMFLLQSSQYLAELKRHSPDIYEATQKAWHTKRKDGNFMLPGQDAWSKIPTDSIDYAVMEKTQKAALLPLQSSWNDIGSWSALSENLSVDQDGNTKMGDVQTKDTHDCLLLSQKRLLATVGLENCVVIETPDVVLVADKKHSQSLKPLVAHLKESQRPEVRDHQKVHRPWGSYESIDLGPTHQVKRIIVQIGQRLSLQMHHHRSEHWVVVKGTARVTCNDDVFLLSENQSTYIPIGAKHRLENIGKIPLEIIEVQSGSYLGEDDIIRFDDQYGRTEKIL